MVPKISSTVGTNLGTKIKWSTADEKYTPTVKI